MAENKEGQEKTETATTKRLHEARMRGQVSKSQDVTTAAVMLFGGLAVIVFGRPLFRNFQEFMKKLFSNSIYLDLNFENVTVHYTEMMTFVAKVLLPILLIIFVISFAAEVSQVGLKIATKKFTEGLNFKRIFNPFSGLKKIFFSGRSFFELAKGFAKLLVLGTIAFQVLNSKNEEMIVLLELPLSDFVSLIVDTSIELVIKISIVYIIIAVVDSVYQKYKFREDMKMTKHEVKEETKQTEGDPKIKQRLRALIRSRLKRMMLQKTKEADVVITNPTHYSVALAYKQDKMNAPVVVAKGSDHLAFQIRLIAQKNDIPIVEEAPLAKALFHMCDVEQEVPESLFKAVAQVLAYVYNLKGMKINI